MDVIADDNIAIRAEGIYKDFKLPHERSSTLKSAFTNIMRGRKNRTVEVQHALKDISFEVKRGEFFGIVGRNGSGKSTLLKILAGIYQPNQGQVTVDGRLVPFIELGVGFNGELTGRENIYLNGAMLGFSKAEVDAMYHKIVDFAELEKFMDQKLKNYSSGMQVRLAFSLAIRAEADILLVDEVLAVGDADFQRKCFSHFRELKKQKKTVVFVSHDMSSIREYCDRAIMIEKSEIIVQGSASQVATEYTKIFTPNQTSTSEGKSRWGDGAIVQTSVTVTPEVCDAATADLELTVNFTAKKQVQNPVFGFLLKNAVGTHIMGTNNKLKLMASGTFKAGQKDKLVWTIPNVFNDGQYFIDVAISHEDGVTQYDWWEDAASFRVYKEERTPYVINPITTLKLPANKK